jgi:tRNA(fMet)-specific endonuclease VapC
MRLCLDTNAYTKLTVGRDTLRHILEQAEFVYLPAIVLGELHAGFAMGDRYVANMQTLSRFLASPGIIVADADSEVAERYGLIVASLQKNGTPLPTNDVWIAATAMRLGTKLVTYDQHFEKIPGLLIACP